MTNTKSTNGRNQRAPGTPPSYVQRYPQPKRLVEWLNEETGRAAYFSKADPEIIQPTLSKMKAGIVPITLADAIRLERAQKASKKPLKALELMTFEEDRKLYRYVTGMDPAPPQLQIVRKSRITVKPAAQPSA